ncbi:Alpha-1,6-mannosylglycoprotein 6-beta-N-acetylglucosaminyltransferase B [Schistosoma japonicum]|nr:Alpha-1,6-mannosylglycoprotein 6-beta-N-acetylglucosaminyltransferase B [Schistosoma japonicum]
MKRFRQKVYIVIFIIVLGVFWLINNDNNSLVEYQIDVASLIRQRGKYLNNNNNVRYDGSYDEMEINYDLLRDPYKNCTFQPQDLRLYPECLSKIDWLRKHWTTHSCYSELGVDGSECSFVRYLSEVSFMVYPLLAELYYIPYIVNNVEQYCPILYKRKFVKQRSEAQVLIYLGFLSNNYGTNFFESTVSKVRGNKYDVIYTDITGMHNLKKQANPTLLCKFRILDTFGTEALYNREKGAFGGLHLNLQQFYTFFPHTPDNTFLGFVTEILPPQNKSSEPNLSKPIALVYGKESYFWVNKTNYLKIFSDYFELHGNVINKGTVDLPSFVHIHQLQYGQPYLKLLLSSHVMIGLGFPYEGPAPLEAIANGLIFLNPRFNPPHSRSTQAFFAEKPTARGLTSQHPYIENHIGEPYSYLVDMDNETQIRQTVERILKSNKSRSYRPHEYSPWGFFERLNAYLTHQDICSSPFYNNVIQSPVAHVDGSVKFNYLDVSSMSVSWPPLSSLKIVLGSPGESCANACMNLQTSEHIFTPYLCYRSLHAATPLNLPYLHTYRCSPEHFPSVNHRLNLQYFGVSCLNVTYTTSPTAPYWDHSTNSCVFQTNHEWFDCTASEKSHVTYRICPCRDALPNQISLCSNCL